MLAQTFDTVKKFVFFGPGQRTRTLKKLAFYIDKNIHLIDALSTLANYATNDGKRPSDPRAKIFSRWSGKVKNGLLLSEAMRGDVPEIERQVIVAGDRNGHLSEGIKEALIIRDGINRIRKALTSAMLYPLMLFSAVIGFFYFMDSKIIPGFRDALPNSETWPSSVLSLAATSAFTTNNLPVILPAFILLTIAFFVSLPRWTGPIRNIVDQYVPYSVYKTMYGTIFLLSLSGYVKAGMNVPIILERIISTAPPWYRLKVATILRFVRQGHNVGDAMHKTGDNFPSREVVEDMRTFSRHRGFETALEESGKEILEMSIASIQAQSRTMRMISIIGVGGLMFWFTNALFDFQTAVAHMAQYGK